MKLSVISFTTKGQQLSVRLKNGFPKETITLYTKCSYATERGVQKIAESLQEWTAKQFLQHNGLIVIGACGIAVRAIAPCLKGKLQDIPVLVVDELGQYVIPILSGHMGGANALAQTVAKQLGAIPVITTATDLRQKFAVDLFAKENRLQIRGKEGIAKISSKILAGEQVTMCLPLTRLAQGEAIPLELTLVERGNADVVISEKEPEPRPALWLQPKAYVLGVGCRKGKTFQEMDAFLKEICQQCQIMPEQIRLLTSLDRKQDEPALLQWSTTYQVPFQTYSAEELNAVAGEFSHSDFVQQKVGVDSVCERAAVRGCDGEGKLLLGKQARDGMTAAVAKVEWRIRFS